MAAGSTEDKTRPGPCVADRRRRRCRRRDADDQRTVPLACAQARAGSIPRRDFDQGQLEELATSIRERGLVQPLVVRPADGEPDTYEIVAGERRWRAAQIANLHEVPVVVRRACPTRKRSRSRSSRTFSART